MPPQDPRNLQRLLGAATALARVAGRRTLEFYGTDCQLQDKQGGEPLTEADRASHETIIEGLAACDAGVPVISEEADLPAYALRSCWRRFWLIDPLDGTKEFLNRNGEFTVNIALIEDNEPVLGVVYAPALDVLYSAARGYGAWKQQSGEPERRIYSSNWQPGRPARIVESRSHPSAALEAFLQTIEIAERIRVGSSLKFCAVAESAADLYARLGPIMEWDAAAGDCVYRCSGQGGQRPSSLRYNQPDMRLNGFVIGSDALLLPTETLGA